MTFLSAKWENLILANYIVDPEILKPFIPNATDLDFYKGNCYVSLVGFMFNDTKVLGVKLPYHINFEEVNLRFYVKHKDKRGVVFIKEIVPKPLISCIANSIYKEHYQSLKMKHSWTESQDSKITEYNWKINKQWQSIKVVSEKTETPILQDTEADFITEHYFGYTKFNSKTFEYEVTHPRWNIFEVLDYKINVDFAENYGKSFEFLNTLKPTSVILAKGSGITVKNKKTIKNQ